MMLGGNGLFVGTIVLVGAGIASGQILGVSPDLQHLYEPILDSHGNKIWKCVSDPSIILNYDQINDDYCDCPDGSDEPGTNACPYSENRSFYCRNEGYFPGYLETYKLNDGVCDYDVCCDGSDEYISGACPDRCSEINRQFQQYKARVEQDISKSIQIKDNLLNEVQSIKKQIITHLDEFRGELVALEAQLARDKTVLQHQSVEPSSAVYHVLSPYIKEISKRFTRDSDKISQQQDKIQQLESILLKMSQNYNPNFNDLAVKESINRYQEYVSNKQEDVTTEDSADHISSLIEHAKRLDFDTESKPYVEPSFSNMVHYYFDAIFEKFLKQQGPDDYEVDKTVDESSLEESKSKIDELKAKIALYEQNLQQDFGEKDIFRSLQNKWTTGRVGDYGYRIGYFDSIYQDDVLIGKFSALKDNKLFFTNGAKCWNGPHRSAEIEFICGSNVKVLSVKEPEKCHYYIEMSSPIVCESFSEEELRHNFKINYDLL